MNDNLIMFTSVTHTMRSRDILKKYNINSKVVRTPIHIKIRSCGYSLFVPKDLDRALQILRSNGISVLGTAAVEKR